MRRLAGRKRPANHRRAFKVKSRDKTGNQNDEDALSSCVFTFLFFAISFL